MAVEASDFFTSSSLDDLITGDSAFKPYKYLPSFKFLLRVDLMFDVPLKSVKPFMRENEYEHIQEGGLNDYVHLRRKSVTKPFTLVVERYVSTDIDDPLPNGYSMTIPLLLFIGRNNGLSMDNPVYNGRWFVFTGARVMNKEYGGLDAERSGLLTETITIGYNSLYCVTNPADTVDDEKAIDFKTEATKKKNKHANVTKNEHNKIHYAALAHLWKFSGKAKGGAGRASSQNAKTFGLTLAGTGGKEATEAELKAKATIWHFSQKAKTGNGNLHQQNGRHGQAADGSPRYDNSTGVTAVELTKEKLALNARKWNFSGKTKAGSGVMSQQFKNSYDSNGELILNPSTLLPIGAAGDEDTRGDWEDLASIWHFNNRSKAGKGPRHVQSGQYGVDENGNPMYDAASGQGFVEASVSELMSYAREWKFTAQDSALGNGIRSAKNNRDGIEGNTGQKELPKSDMAAKASLWRLNSYSKEGAGKASRETTLTIEQSLGEMIAKAAKWEIVKDSKTGAGVASRDVTTGPQELSKADMAGKAQKKELKPEKSAKPTPRKWPESKSAQENPKTGATAKVRKWPPNVSAQRNPDKGTDPKARKWPEESSARKNPNTGSDPAPRKWPPVKSAASITDFLMK